MENLLNDLAILDGKIDSVIDNGIKEFSKIPKQFSDRLPAAKNQLTKKSELDLTSQIKGRLEDYKTKILSIVEQSKKQALKDFHSGRQSWNREEQILAENLYQSAITLLSTKNENMILNEFRRSAIDDNRHEFTFTILENFLSLGLSKETEDKIIEAAKGNEKINDYLFFLKVKKDADDILDKINYQIPFLESGSINGNYDFNKSIRKVRDDGKK